MSTEAIIRALGLPDESRVDQRVPKKLLLEKGAPTAADRRLIQNGMGEIAWVAALKPSAVGVPAYYDVTREYLEIAVVTAALKPGAQATRLLKLIHRAIPYPVLLVAVHGPAIAVSLAHKRRSESGVGRVVLEAVENSGELDPAALAPEEEAFVGALALSKQPRRDMFVLYQGWMDAVSALAAARLTGRYLTPRSPEHATARRAALSEHARARRELSALVARAQRETQIQRRMELNLEIRRLRGRLIQLKAEL
jgi:hypothetical protein